MSQPVPVNVSATDAIKVGDVFTIAGVRLLPNGRFLTNCKRGEETRLVNSERPSIYKLGPRIVASS